MRAFQSHCMHFTMSCLSRLSESNYYLFELFIFFRLLALSISAIAISLLIQDKICVVSYGQSTVFCQYIESDANTTEAISVRNNILSQSTIFGNYKNLVECVPMVIWSLFVGSFLDHYEDGTMVMLFLNVLGDVFSTTIYLILVHYFLSSPYYLLIASLYVWFTGGIMGLTTTAYRYISLNTDENTRALKFVILEIIFVIGLSISIFLGGVLLVVRSNSTIPRTYNRNFILTLGFDIVSFVLLFLLYQVQQTKKRRKEMETSTQTPKELTVVYSVDHDVQIQNGTTPVSNGAEKRKVKRNKIEINKASDKQQNDFDEIDLSDLSSSSQSSNLSINNNPSSTPQDSADKSEQSTNIFKVLFNFDNVRETVYCFLKPREHNVRMQIYFIFAVLFNQVLVSSGISGVLLQFVENMYSWNTQMYSMFVAVTSIVSTVVLAISSIFLVKMWKLDDGSLIVLAQLSTFLADVIIGSILSAIAYFVSIFVGSLSGYAVICMRTKLSKIVPEDEVGKIFSLSCTLEALVPLISSLIYSNIFIASISYYPTLIYQFSAGVMLLSLIIMVLEVFLCPLQSKKQHQESQQQQRGQQQSQQPQNDHQDPHRQRIAF